MKFYEILVILTVFNVAIEAKTVKSPEKIQARKRISVQQISNHKHHKQHKHHKHPKRMLCMCIGKQTTNSPLTITSISNPLIVNPESGNANEIEVIPSVDGSQPIVVVPTSVTGAVPVVVVSATTAAPGQTTTMGPGKWNNMFAFSCQMHSRIFANTCTRSIKCKFFR